MQQIKKKYLAIAPIDEDSYNYIHNRVDEIPKNDINEFIPHLVTNKNVIIQGFFYKNDKKTYIVPEPNPVIIYFNNAFSNLKPLTVYKEKLFIELDSDIPNMDIILNYFYTFYGFAINFTSSLCEALEAFTNSRIPIEYKWRGKDKSKIIRFASIKDKLKIVIPDISNGKDFTNEYYSKYLDIENLICFRNDITHAKSDISHKINYYNKLFISSLDFDYSNVIESVKEYINYYEPNLIEVID